MQKRLILWAKGLGVALTVALLAAFLCVACLDVPQQPAVSVASAAEVLRVETVALTATGDAGAATGVMTTTNALTGELAWLYIDYTASISTTTDITLSYVSPLGGQVFAKTDSATDAMWYPVASPVTNAAAAITDGHVPFVLSGKLQIDVGQSTSGTVGSLLVAYWR